MRPILILGDVIMIALITVIGFSTHRELGTAPLTRMLAVFIPLTVSWFLLAPFLGLFDAALTADGRQLWRVPLAALFAGPLAALIRAFMLGSVVIPIFALVLSGTTALGMLVWRGLALSLRRALRK